MIGRLATGPPSPPTSPRMSDIPGKLEGLQWDQTSGVTPTAHHHQAGLAKGVVVAGGQQNKNGQQRPALRSIKSFPYSLGPSSRLQDDVVQEETNGSLSSFKERVLSQGPQPTASADLPPPTFGGSAPTSPVERLTPRSQETVAAGQDDAPMVDEEMDLEGGEQEEDGERPPMTAAELRAHKRKMKRFR